MLRKQLMMTDNKKYIGKALIIDNSICEVVLFFHGQIKDFFVIRNTITDEIHCKTVKDVLEILKP